MSADKGKSYLPQIKAAYQALNEANANKLVCAVRLGDVLNQAAETIKASYGKGAWGPWLEMNCPEISHRTANIYMTLAKNKDVVEEAFSQRAAIMGTNGDLSIRGAIDAVNKSLGKTKPPSKKKSSSKPKTEQTDIPKGPTLPPSTLMKSSPASSKTGKLTSVGVYWSGSSSLLNRTSWRYGSMMYGTLIPVVSSSMSYRTVCRKRRRRRTRPW
jgi:hypothetical protein